MTPPPQSLDALALSIGHANIAWAALQDSLGHLFSAVVCGGLDDVALATWHCHKNDRAQRDMLSAATKVKLEMHPDLEKGIISFLNKFDGMVDLRNDMIHSSYAILRKEDGTETAIPNGYYGNRCAKKLEKAEELGSYPEPYLVIRFEKFREEILGATRTSDEYFQRVVKL